ncbi:hypothetical protein OK414_20920 [Priestia sp. JV24]|uniref:hypothetical protein n=1 Tax=Priestia TaxID=2800373 RepID=UPI0021D69C92|nr:MULTISPECIES: hypothetical protein [Priestia]MCU7707880.1 hypothetical protein [Priestia megaterium]MCW1047504.1 hypothetical protein [Priestia sp. JV24]
MKGQFAAISYSLYVELKYLMIRFWTILLAFVVVDIFVFSQVNEHLLLVTSMPQYIFSGIVSFIIIRKSFSFCLKLGATRKAYLLTMTSVFALFAIVMSLINVVIMSISIKVINSLNLMNIQLYYASDFIFHGSTVTVHFLTDAVFIFFITAASCLLGSIVYKFGQTGGMITGAVLILLFTIPVTKEPVIHFIKSFSNGSLLLTFGTMVIASFLFFLINWLFLKKASPVHQA